MSENPFESPAPTTDAPEMPERERPRFLLIRQVIGVVLQVVGLPICFWFFCLQAYLDEHPEISINAWIVAEFLLLGFGSVFFFFVGYRVGRPWPAALTLKSSKTTRSPFMRALLGLVGVMTFIVIRAALTVLFPEMR